ncbi:MAG: hypothetical protein WDW38_010267 [Sanguina aurantia]
MGIGSLRPSFSKCSQASRPARLVRVQASNGGGEQSRDISERVFGALPYLLPLLDAFPFARFLFMQYPFVARALSPLEPLMGLYHAFPFAPFLIFLGVYNGIVNNQSLSRFVRYNAMQAVLLDVLLIIPQVVLQDVIKPPQDELGLQAYITVYNTIFLFFAICAAIGMGSSLVGQASRLPIVGEAAEIQVSKGGGGM